MISKYYPRTEKKIILICGTSGTGKTTLARELSNALYIDHRLSTGFIREAIRSEMTIQAEPELYNFTFRTENPFEHFGYQARRLYDATFACIERARNEGTSLIIEGSTLTPNLYHSVGVDALIVLAAPAKDEHWRRITGDTHCNRVISANDFENARRIDEYLREEAAEYNVPRIQFENNFEQIL